MKLIKKLCMLVLMIVPAMVFASETVHLDTAPGNLNDKASLQRGAQFFIANCLACHSAAYMRYNRLMDIGMSEEEIRKLLPEGGKLGSTMKAMMDSEAAKGLYGVAPPDLSVEVRARGADWVYTYLRSFYADPTRTSLVNNVVFPLVAMPNFMLVGLQGEQALVVEKHEGGHEVQTLKLTTPGTMSTKEFDATVGDLVNFMDFMSEPAKLVRYKLGYIVLGFLFVLLILTYLLKKEFWKDVH
jgi:ubiquinol-cytochrome c reductase cytochrome c1 subunit